MLAEEKAARDHAPVSPSLTLPHLSRSLTSMRSLSNWRRRRQRGYGGSYEWDKKAFRYQRVDSFRIRPGPDCCRRRHPYRQPLVSILLLLRRLSRMGPPAGRFGILQQGGRILRQN